MEGEDAGRGGGAGNGEVAIAAATERPITFVIPVVVMLAES